MHEGLFKSQSDSIDSQLSKDLNQVVCWEQANASEYFHLIQKESTKHRCRIKRRGISKEPSQVSNLAKSPLIFSA